jgi:hypothetical protein
LALTLSLASACVIEQPVDLVVRGSSAGPGESTVTVRVVAGGCTGPDMPTTGTTVYDETVGLGETLPPVGALEDRSYAFSAFFSTMDCSISRYGCTEVNPLDASPVTIDVAAVTVPTGCDATETCALGMCVPIDPPPSRCTSDGGCTTTDGSEGICCEDGHCASATEGCTPTSCGDISTSVTDCGACGHRCPMGLGCAQGLCQAVPALDVVFVEVDADTGSLPDGGARAAFLWQAPNLAGVSDPMLLGVTDGGPFEVRPGESIGIPLPSLDGVPREVWLDATGDVGDVALASVIVVRDDPAGGPAISLARVMEAMATPSPDFYGVVLELVVVASRDGVPREGIAGSFFPEGAPAGVTLHRGTADGAALLPTANNTGRLALCESTTEADQRTCVMNLADPVSGR